MQFLELSQNTDYNLVIDGPGLRNAFYAGVLKAFQENNIALPKTLLTWSGGVPIAVAYLLGMDMREILLWSKDAFPIGVVNPEKIKEMYSGFCDLIYEKYTPEQIKEKLKPLKMLTTNKEKWIPHIFENFSGERAELMSVMIASAGIPGVTQKTSAPFWDGQFMLSLGEIAPEEIIVHGRDNIPRVTLSVSKRVGSTIHLDETPSTTEGVSGWKKVSSPGTLSYSPKRAEELYQKGYKIGLQYIQD